MSYDYNILIAGTAYRYVYPLINYKLFSICRHYSTFQAIWKYQKKWRIFFNTIEQNSYQFTESWKKINISRKRQQVKKKIHVQVNYSISLYTASWTYTEKKTCNKATSTYTAAE